jgi:putative restriction endonuclease
VRFWWVNQKQTHRQEIGGGYLWSPKRSARARNQFYENMKIVAPGDVVFCYWETAVRARGVVQSFGYDAPKPDEFGDAGRNWSHIGYRADVFYGTLPQPVRPREDWLSIQRLLPEKYSPLHKEKGIGLQSVYLAALPDALGEHLDGLIRDRGNLAVADRGQFNSLERAERDRWERHELAELEALSHCRYGALGACSSPGWPGKVSREREARRNELPGDGRLEFVLPDCQPHQALAPRSERGTP